MSAHPSRPSCPDCSPLTRREFIRTAAGAAAAATASLTLGSSATALAKAAKPSSETLCQQLYSTLTEKQKKAICFGFDHKLRSEVDNNWHITKTELTKFFTPQQQELVKQIFMGLHSQEYAPKVYQQVEHDGGFGKSSVAFFGEPGTGKFEFVLTGRHCTRRCDGDSVEGAAFGGPIFYGHAAESFHEKPDHKGNVYWYQAIQANEVFKALDGKQRSVALLDDFGREENASDTVALTGKAEGLPGIRCSELSRDQKELVSKTLGTLLAMFRPQDVAEVMRLVEVNGGVDSLSMAFFKKQDIGNDGVWDVWQIEGPAMLWYFRGKPHVHTWVHIRERV